MGGSDIIRGGGGRDELLGNDGDDKIIVGGDQSDDTGDHLYGGRGNDT